MTRPLTPRQREALAAFTAHWERFGEAPTMRELGQALGLSSSQSVFSLLTTLVRKGALVRVERPGKWPELRPPGAGPARSYAELQAENARLRAALAAVTGEACGE